MTIRRFSPGYAALLFFAGCASTGESPLIFGQSNTVGISVGASAGEQGGDFTVGYKGQNFAIVPVTMVQPGGGSDQIGGSVQDNKFLDAYSVLGQFQVSTTRQATPNVGLGKFFATGLAAKRLADGFAAKMGDRNGGASSDCRSPSSTPSLQAQKPAAVPSVIANASTTAAADQRKPVNTSLVFAQYDSLGLSIGAAGTQQGADFTLGYKDRNFAVIPSITREPDGKGVMVRSKATRSDGSGADEDALSVLGQFELKTEENANTFTVGLGKFFSTGVAAKRLSDGFATRLCEEYQSQAQRANPPAKDPAKKDGG